MNTSKKTYQSTHIKEFYISLSGFRRVSLIDIKALDYREGFLFLLY